MRGLSAWVITDGKAGSESQALGVAGALGLDAALKRAAPTGLYRLIAPYGPPDPRVRFGETGSDFAPPWPDVAISIGRRSLPVLRALQRAAGGACFTIVLQDPRAGANIADVVWVPEHDRLRGPNVITTPTSPHGFPPERLAVLREHMPPAIAALPKPKVAVLLGGKNRVFRFTDADHDRFAGALASMARLGASFLITPSRRTHDGLLRAAIAGIGDAPALVYDGTGPNPYADFLAHADMIVVSADSISMTGEATATGAPVYVFHPSRGSAKFARFHEALERQGACRELPAVVDRLDGWRYTASDATSDIRDAIVARYLAWRGRRGGEGEGG